MIALREIEIDEFFEPVGELAGEAKLAEACANVVGAHLGLIVRPFRLTEI